MIEAEKAQHLWFAVGFLWTLSIVIAFFLAKVIKPRSINIENKTPKMEIEKRQGLEVTPESIKYDFPSGYLKRLGKTGDTGLWGENQKNENRESYIQFLNKKVDEKWKGKLNPDESNGGARKDIKEAAKKLEEILEENTEEAVKERVTLTIVTTRDAMKKLEKIKAASGKSFSRIITEKIL